MFHHSYEFVPSCYSDCVAIDFTVDDVNIPLHISLRPAKNEVVINSLSDGVWAAERIQSYDYSSSGRHIVDIQAASDVVNITIDGDAIFSDEPVIGVGHHASVVTLLPRLDLESIAIPEMVHHSYEFVPSRYSGWVTIDFAVDDVNIPLHISLRTTKNEVVVNSLADGVWATERVQSYAYSLSGRHIVDIQAGSDIVNITIDGNAIFLNEPVIGVTDRANVVTVLTRLEQQSGEPQAIRVAGKDFKLKLLDQSSRDYIRDVFVPFLSTRSLVQDGLILDLTETRGVVSAILQEIFPGSQVVAICQSLETEREANCRAISLAELLAALGAQEPQINSVNESAELAQLVKTYLNDGRLTAIFSRDLFSSDDGGPFNLLAPYMMNESVAICASETNLAQTMRAQVLRDHERDLLIKFANSPWAWRKDRYGDANKRADRLDIGVAMYNMGQYIVQCLQSLLTESRDDIGVILVDDGSTDDSLAIVAKEFGHHPRLKILSKLNGGCASARNFARLHSDARYLTFVDADDFVDPEMFPNLLDLARVSGSEIVQGGFVFHDSETGASTPSYEVEQFENWARIPFKDATCFRVHSAQLIAGQPTIWRRVYRRDFLDNKNIWFPEHIRAFDDMIFHLTSIYLARDVITLDGFNYSYRQHPAQDIKQGDERHFYELEMYRMLAKRAIREGWNDFGVFAPGIVNTINWSLECVRDDLVLPFLEGAAELWALLERAFGSGCFSPEQLAKIRNVDFAYAVKAHRSKLASCNMGYAAAFIDGAIKHPSTLIMSRQMRAAAES